MTTPLEIRNVKITDMDFNESENVLSTISEFTLIIYQNRLYTSFKINVVDSSCFLVQKHKNLLIFDFQERFDSLFENCILPAIRTKFPSFYEKVLPLFNGHIKDAICYRPAFYQWINEFFIKLEEINMFETEFFRNIPTVFDTFYNEYGNYEKDFEKLKNQFDRKIYKYIKSDFKGIYETLHRFKESYYFKKYQLESTSPYLTTFIENVAKAFLESSQGFSCQFEDPDLYVFLKILTK